MIFSSILKILSEKKKTGRLDEPARSWVFLFRGIDYLYMPMLTGGGAGSGAVSHAVIASEVAAMATTAAILTNLINVFPLLSLRDAGRI
ncbi:MAG: hypothetical protein WA771_02045 [Chthoniobacterales bacterium]